MLNDYRKNKRVVRFVKKNIAKMDEVDERFKPLLEEIMLRRFSEFDFNEAEMNQDMKSLVNNLYTISVGELPKEIGTAGGAYFPAEKKIIISERYFNAAKKPEDYEKVYAIMSHEVFHALSKDENGNKKISGINSITKMYNNSLEEAIVEKAADRCVHSRRWNEQNAPFFHQNDFGYTDITYITDAMVAAYGITEYDFLKRAIQGREKVAEFLASISGEEKDESMKFLDSIEINYSSLYQMLYNRKEGQTINVENLKGYMSASLKVAAWKLRDNIERLKINSPDFEDRLEILKYSHDKMFIVANEASKKFETKFGANINKDVMDVFCLKDDILSNSYRLTTMSEILKRKEEIPKDDFDKLLVAAQKGLKETDGENLFGKYQINIEEKEFIALRKDNYLKYRQTDFEMTEWDNSDIIEKIQMLGTPNKGFFYTLKDSIKTLKTRFGSFFKQGEEQKVLGPGEEPTVHSNKTENFASLTPDQLQEFRRGEQAVIQDYKDAEIISKDDSEIIKKRNQGLDEQGLE